MTAETITFVYNEEFLLPFYLNHYSWVDKINIFLDNDTDDSSKKILEDYSKKLNINIIPFTFLDGLNDFDKVVSINNLYKSIESDYVLNVDCDEFIFIDKLKLNEINSNFMFVKLGTVYRQSFENDLRIDLPIKEQRRYGVFDLRYQKPIIVKSKLNIQWCVGNHVILENNNYYIKQKDYTDYNIYGAHWSMADPCYCIDRKIKNRIPRVSSFNIKYNLGLHGLNSREKLLQEIQNNQNCNKLW